MEPSSTVDFVLAVSGGSGSGKTTLVRELQKALGEEFCDVLSQDDYYRDASQSFDHDGGAINFDHPDSLEFSLMRSHLQSLRDGDDIDIPKYCFKTHARIGTNKFTPEKPILLVDGILLFSQEDLLPQFDVSIFVDAEENLRFNRRLSRDVKERGRSPDGVKEQFEKQVKPMHDRFVEPTKDLADIVCQGANPIDESVAMVLKNSALQKQIRRCSDQSIVGSESGKFDRRNRPKPESIRPAY